MKRIGGVGCLRVLLFTFLLSLVGGINCYAREVYVRFVLDQVNKDRGDVVAVLVKSENEFILAMDNLSSINSFYKREIRANTPNRLVRFDIDDTVTEFAIIAFQDIQRNGRLDKGTFAPMEPVGFSGNPSHSFDMPDYAETVIRADSMPSEIVVKVY